jgi:hypothetical protein
VLLVERDLGDPCSAVAAMRPRELQLGRVHQVVATVLGTAERL